MSRLLAVTLAVVLVGTGCASRETPKEPARPRPPLTPQNIPPPPPSNPPVRSESPPRLREMLPGVRADIEARLVEFDGIVPINCHDPRTPDVYLEVIVCTPDTKEHESLVMTKAKASNIHAALLAIGLTPGSAGNWKFEDRKFIPVPPTGPGVDVRLAYRDATGKEIESPAGDWVVNASNGAPFGSAASGDHGWVFAGSRMAMHQGKEYYDADGVGTVVGLVTFGSETVAWKRVISHEAEINEPEWIANRAKVPAYGTKVTVRLRPSER